MAQVIGVRFKDVGKIYYFDPLDLEIIKGSRVIVETARGVECGEVAMERKEVSDEGLVQPLKPVIRVATKEDLKKVEENHEKEKQDVYKRQEYTQYLKICLFHTIFLYFRKFAIW